MKKLLLSFLGLMLVGMLQAQGTLSAEQRKFASDYLTQTKNDYLKSIDQ